MDVTSEFPSADRHDGTYVNPILPGDWPDPSVIRIGGDYFMTHSSFRYAPGLLIWHSRDLVNWEPLCNALREYAGNVYAPDLVFHDRRFHIYFPAGKTNWVVTAPSIQGPWTSPHDLQVAHIDPGHAVGLDGKRYLHLSGGNFVPLTDDGLSTAGPVRHVYDGWPIPREWVIQGFCLESPKITFRNGWYYLTVAQGGTAGPATSHMVVSSRSRNVDGPWEHSPHNPIVHTASRDETWWSRGHGTLVDTPDGRWYILYHGYRRGYHTLGRQTLMEPVEWTPDGWFRVVPGTVCDQPIPMPPGEPVPHGLMMSDDLAVPDLAPGWRFYQGIAAGRYELREGALWLKAQGTTVSDASPVTLSTAHEAYVASVELTVHGGADAGLVLFYNPDGYLGVGLKQGMAGGLEPSSPGGSGESSGAGGPGIAGGVYTMRRNSHTKPLPYEGGRIFLRVINDRHEVQLQHSRDGLTWEAHQAIESSGYHHNVFGGFTSLRVGLYCTGQGSAEFRNFRYEPLP